MQSHDRSEARAGSLGRQLPGRRCSLAAGGLCLALTACSATGNDLTVANGSGGTASDLPSAVACRSASSEEPRSITSVVAWVNALPKPASLPCFVESLPRPLALYATESIVSAQPAVGRRSPRLFIFSEPLIMSVAPDGVGSHLLELGELRPNGTRALKAEIAFPVSEELSPEAPFEQILFTENLTTCGGCHADEEPAEDITFTRAFVSQALRPLARERVGLAELRAEVASCDPEREPERCALLHALFDPGEVVDAEFPADLRTFY